MAVYYNEIDPFPAQWLRNLIAAGHLPGGDVDERSIEDVHADDLIGYYQCHFFAGIGGWPLALSLAGWEGPVWTGSCPCQPWSSAARGSNRKAADARHLWPTWLRLIRAANPDVVFGEQVAGARDWLDEVAADLEAIGHRFRAAILPAYAVGADHARERIYFASHPDSNGEPKRRIHAQAPRMPRPYRISERVADEDGLPNRMGLLRAYGNAIVPQVGAAFVSAFMECAP